MTLPPRSTQEVLQYSSITMGYSDSEDRLWIRLVRPQGEAKLWMTRRLLLALIDKSYELLVRDLSVADAADEHQQAVSEFLKQKGDPAPPRNPEVATDISSGLVNSVDVSVTANSMDWVFVSAQGKAKFRSNREEAHRLLEAFWASARSANWADRAPWDQLNSKGYAN